MDVLGFGAAWLGFGLGDFDWLGFGVGDFDALGDGDGLGEAGGDGASEGVGTADESSEICGGLAQATGDAAARFVAHAAAPKISRPAASRAPRLRVRACDRIRRAMVALP